MVRKCNWRPAAHPNRRRLYSYRLMPGGYSLCAHTLLLSVTGRSLSNHFLATFNTEEGSLKFLFPLTHTFFDFAWVLGKPAFVVTHGDGMILFEKDDSPDGYGGTAIRCPTRFSYTFCSWSPKRRWLATTCTGSEERTGTVLGLYAWRTEKFVVTDIPVGYGTPIWQDEATVYVTKDNCVMKVRLDSGVPKVVRTIAFRKEVAFFFGMFGGRPLAQMRTKLRLGRKTLAERGTAYRYRVVATQTAIFVSVSAMELVAFDHQGRQIDRTNPRRLIHLGSVGDNPDTIYGLAGGALMRVCLERGHLNIQQVCDLDGLLGPPSTAPCRR
jgi:hypothetical protein